jgi:glycerate-2-kinase
LMRGLGSMSNIEFQNMQAIGTSLGPQIGETGFTKELNRLIETTDKAIKATPSKTQSASGGGVILTDPTTGESFDASDLSAAEYQQALSDGLIEG